MKNTFKMGSIAVWVVIVILAILLIIGFTSKKSGNISIDKNQPQEQEQSIAGDEEVFENSPGAIKSITLEGASEWVLEVDILTPNPEWLPGVNEHFINQNTKIRTLSVTDKTKTYICNENNPNKLQTTTDFMQNIESNVGQAQSDIQHRIGGPIELMTDWVTYYFDITGTDIIAIYYPCLP